MIGAAMPALDDVVDNQPITEAAARCLARWADTTISISRQYERAQGPPGFGVIETLLDFRPLVRCRLPTVGTEERRSLRHFRFPNHRRRSWLAASRAARICR